MSEETQCSCRRKLTPEEVEQLKKEAQEIFDSYDVDKSGYVDATEVENVFRAFNQEGSFITFTEEELKELGALFVELGDANSDGKVSFEEFYKSMLETKGLEV